MVNIYLSRVFIVGEEECRARVVSLRLSVLTLALASASEAGNVAPIAPILEGQEGGATPPNLEKPEGGAQTASTSEGGSPNREEGGGGEREEQDDGEAGGAPNEGGERRNSGDSAGGTVGPYDELWRCDDGADWTPELAHAHTTFETGRE
jgi:hypothetical protein